MSNNILLNDNLWDGQYKIPWNDPEFSKRMLAEHLSQDHDLASRKTEWIEKQVAWIHNNTLNGKPAKILDLGCGPGLYCHRLTKLGHNCHGIDFSPASIEYAIEHNCDSQNCTFQLGDVTKSDYGCGCDLVIFLFGELNVFSPQECDAILKKAYNALKPGGKLIVETQKAEAVQQIGLSEQTEQHYTDGLFCPAAHTCITENHWIEEQNVCIQIFRIIEDSDGKESIYRSTTRGLSDEIIKKNLSNAGFTNIEQEPKWPKGSEFLAFWLANKIAQ